MVHEKGGSETEIYNLSLAPEHSLLFWISPFWLEVFQEVGSVSRRPVKGKADNTCVWICKNELHTDLSAAVTSSSLHNWCCHIDSVFSLEDTHISLPKNLPGPPHKWNWSYEGERLVGAEVSHLQLYSSNLASQEYAVLWDVCLTAFEYLAEVSWEVEKSRNCSGEYNSLRLFPLSPSPSFSPGKCRNSSRLAVPALHLRLLKKKKKILLMLL